jgi:2OG-Fe dioxygenase
MSDASTYLGASRHDSIWSDLIGQGYVLIDDETIGLPEKFRTNFHQAYFNNFTIRHDEGDFPVDRKRARDVIRFQWSGEFFDVTENDAITITDRAGINGKRDHRRVEFLRDGEARNMVGAFLSLVPPHLRPPESTFGVNLFRTFTDVVTKPHRDNERFVILYVLDRVGGGAVSYLYRPQDVSEAGEPLAEPLLRHQLNPGEILIFDDERFFHGATPLIAPPGERTGRRDAVVCTVDYPETYIAA